MLWLLFTKLDTLEKTVTDIRRDQEDTKKFWSKNVLAPIAVGVISAFIVAKILK